MSGSFRAAYAAVLAVMCFVGTYLSGRAELAVLGVLLLGFVALEVHGVRSRRRRPGPAPGARTER